MNPPDLKYWLALKLTQGVGNVGFKNLVTAFGSPPAVFEAPVAALQQVPHITQKAARNIQGFNDWQPVDRELEMADRLGVSIVTSDSPLYPPLLLNIYDFPPVLYLKGTLAQSDLPLAVVGSRMASTYGRYTTERLCRELALSGITIVSGMARGIDSAAHTGALAGKGRTVAVLGSGLDVVYPPENRELFERIAESGAVITEFPFSTRPVAANFPARNRIISGISLGVVVVEAGEKSGSLITARVALEQGREVFAVPGSIDSPGTKGTHRLIREGAKLVEGTQDILEEILPQVDLRTAPDKPAVETTGKTPGVSSGELEAAEQAILKALGATPIHIDTLAADTGYQIQNLLGILMSLELKGFVTQLPGKIFAAKE